KYINLKDEYAEINWSVCNSNFTREFLQVICYVFLKIKLSPYFNTKFCGKDEFVNLPMWYKYIYMVISMVVLRGTYYSVWKLSQASLNLCGLSYTKKTSKEGEITESCDKVDNCNLEKIELNLNPRTRIQYWNRTVHLWLKYHLFLRL